MSAKSSVLSQTLSRDSKNSNKKQKKNAPKQKLERKMAKVKCYRCEEFGHYARDCPTLSEDDDYSAYRDDDRSSDESTDSSFESSAMETAEDAPAAAGPGFLPAPAASAKGMALILRRVRREPAPVVEALREPKPQRQVFIQSVRDSEAPPFVARLELALRISIVTVFTVAIAWLVLYINDELEKLYTPPPAPWWSLPWRTRLSCALMYPLCEVEPQPYESAIPYLQMAVACLGALTAFFAMYASADLRKAYFYKSVDYEFVGQCPLEPNADLRPVSMMARDAYFADSALMRYRKTSRDGSFLGHVWPEVREVTVSLEIVASCADGRLHVNKSATEALSAISHRAGVEDRVLLDRYVNMTAGVQANSAVFAYHLVMSQRRSFVATF